MIFIIVISYESSQLIFDKVNVAVLEEQLSFWAFPYCWW
jgi:hypothetical protein